MKLSEAIRLGSLLVSEPKHCDLRSCAMGMANLATNGYVAKDWDDTGALDAFDRTFPWLAQIHVNCPFDSHARPGRAVRGCNSHKTMSGSIIVWHPFDCHVMTGEITIEQLADWIATIEPKDETPSQSKETEFSLMMEALVC